MPSWTHMRRRRGAWELAVLTIAVLAGGAVALISSLASASSFSLKVEKNVHVTNDPTKAFRVKPVNATESVAVGPSGFAVYTFQGETTHHLICQKTSSAATNCWGFWPPATPAQGKTLSKQSGIRGKLGSFRNHGTLQMTLNGQPLYYFTPDLTSHNRRQATGDELKTFGSIWHIVPAGTSASRGAISPQPTTTNTTPTTPYTTPTTPPYNYSY